MTSLIRMLSLQEPQRCHPSCSSRSAKGDNVERIVYVGRSRFLTSRPVFFVLDWGANKPLPQNGRRLLVFNQPFRFHLIGGQQIFNRVVNRSAIQSYDE